MASKKKTTRGRDGACFLNNLPRELIEQVLLRLPASNLVQYVSVCKMWREIIRDSQFAMAHLQHAPSCTLIFSPKGSDSDGSLYPSDAVLFDEAWIPSKWAVPVIGPDDLICGSCNGLLCLHTPTSTIKIANLATGEHLHLKKPTSRFLNDDHFSFYRFGFHPTKKEYMVIHFLQDCDHNTTGRCNVIQVYTLGDEKWKDVATPQSLSLSCVTNSGVVIVNGTMYWLTEDSAAHWQHVVASFDLGEESFAQIQLPAFDLEDLEYVDHRRYWITEIEGKVCVSSAQSFDRMLLGDLQIWALNENADQSWSQMYNIHFSSLFARGLDFVQGKRIIFQNRDKNLYSYGLYGKNIKTELSKMVKLLDLSPRGQEDMQFYSYVKSIVPLHLYVKAATIRRPRLLSRRLQKWKSWESYLLKKQELWEVAHEYERKLSRTKEKISQMFPDDMIQPASTEIDMTLQPLPGCPYQYPSPVRRLNWVENMQDWKRLLAHLSDTLEGWNQVNDKIDGVLENYRLPLLRNVN